MPQIATYPVQSNFSGLPNQKSFEPGNALQALKNVQLTHLSKPNEEMKKPEVARKKNSKEQMTEIMRNMHKERVML